MPADIKVNVFLVSRSMKALQQSAYEPIKKDTGLTQMELQIIFSIKQSPVAVTVGAIHRQTGFNKGQISVCVGNLYEKGYLTKVENSKNQFDAFVLSQKGDSIAERIEKNTSLGRKKLLAGFTQEEADKFKEFLERLQKNAKEFEGKVDFE
jgi:DNA-binding MarR family transcriptional regulator